MSNNAHRVRIVVDDDDIPDTCMTTSSAAAMPPPPLTPSKRMPPPSPLHAMPLARATTAPAPMQVETASSAPPQSKTPTPVSRVTPLTTAMAASADEKANNMAAPHRPIPRLHTGHATHNETKANVDSAKAALVVNDVLTGAIEAVNHLMQSFTVGSRTALSVVLESPEDNKTRTNVDVEVLTLDANQMYSVARPALALETRRGDVIKPPACPYGSACALLDIAQAMKALGRDCFSGELADVSDACAPRPISDTKQIPMVCGMGFLTPDEYERLMNGEQTGALEQRSCIFCQRAVVQKALALALRQNEHDAAPRVKVNITHPDGRRETRALTPLFQWFSVKVDCAGGFNSSACLMPDARNPNSSVVAPIPLLNVHNLQPCFEYGKRGTLMVRFEEPAIEYIPNPAPF